ncbi:MAG: YgjV family protein [Oscillospiraceae bacterium]|nr:YgjV family protein [Oscillospiraceae bacterium]
MEIVAQIIGIVVTILCIVSTQLKRKWQMLFISFVANFLNVIMFFLLNGVTSAVMVSLTASAQCAVNCFLAYKNKEPSTIQRIIFTVLYVVSGVLQYSVFLDILPILASLLFMVSVFQKTEQKLRIFCLANAVVWIVYDSIIGTTAVLGQIFSLVSILVALYRYRKQKS